MQVLLENTTFSLHKIIRNAGIIRIAGIIRGDYEEIRYLQNNNNAVCWSFMFLAVFFFALPYAAVCRILRFIYPVCLLYLYVYAWTTASGQNCLFATLSTLCGLSLAILVLWC